MVLMFTIPWLDLLLLFFGLLIVKCRLYPLGKSLNLHGQADKWKTNPLCRLPSWPRFSMTSTSVAANKVCVWNLFVSQVKWAAWVIQSWRHVFMIFFFATGRLDGDAWWGLLCGCIFTRNILVLTNTHYTFLFHHVPNFDCFEIMASHVISHSASPGSAYKGYIFHDIRVLRHVS